MKVYPMIIVALVIFIAPLFGVLIGAFSGWVVSLFMDETVRSFMTALFPALKDFQLWQIGAGLGFLGGFFKSTLTSSK